MDQRIYGLADGNGIGMDVTTGGFASQKMIDLNLKLQLPPPWKGQVFETDKIGPVNFLVGPNGSGKSQFAMTLFNWLKTQPGGARFR
jgi:predicted AAA+ superfamily ATPase